MHIKWQPIHYACECGHEELICELIDKHGVNPHVEDQVRYNDGPCSNCYIALVDPQNGTTPLHWAIAENHRLIVELFLNKYNTSPTESIGVGDQIHVEILLRIVLSSHCRMKSLLCMSVPSMDVLIFLTGCVKVMGQVLRQS